MRAIKKLLEEEENNGEANDKIPEDETAERYFNKTCNWDL
jgi:hypothetical protein